MKKLFSAFLSAALIFSLSACAGGSAATPTPAPDPREMLSAAYSSIETSPSADTSANASIVLSFSGKDVSFGIEERTVYTGQGTEEYAYSHHESLTDSDSGSVITEADTRYINGVCYVADRNASYKAPLTADEFSAFLDESMTEVVYDVAALDYVSFVEAASPSGTPASAEPTDDASYEITYSGAGIEMLEAVAKLVGDDTLVLDEENSYFSGTAVLNADGSLKSDIYALNCSGTYGDLPVELEVTVFNVSQDASTAVIEPPESLVDYGTVSDIRIPSKFLALYPQLTTESALSFSADSKWVFTVDPDSDTYENHYDGSVIYGDSLSFVLQNTGSLNSITWTSDERYANGVLNGVYNGVSESVTTYTDSDFTTSLLTIYYAYPISWENVKNVTMTEADGVVTFEFDYTDDYVGLVVSNCYAYLYDMNDLTSYALSSNITSSHAVVTADAGTGRLLSHSFDIAAVYNISGTSLSVKGSFELCVDAVGDDVVITDGSGAEQSPSVTG